jgi:hypothetical protein
MHHGGIAAFAKHVRRIQVRTMLEPNLHECRTAVEGVRAKVCRLVFIFMHVYSNHIYLVVLLAVVAPIIRYSTP